MGAWGSGLQANDSALDFTGAYKRELKASVKAGKLTVKAFQRFTNASAEGDNAGILAGAEWLLDEGMPLKGIESVTGNILAAIDEELGDDQLNGWSEPQERADVLNNFKLRMNGKKYDKELAEASNAGLMSKLGKVFEPLTVVMDLHYSTLASLTGKWTHVKKKDVPIRPKTEVALNFMVESGGSVLRQWDDRPDGIVLHLRNVYTYHETVVITEAKLTAKELAKIKETIPQ